MCACVRARVCVHVRARVCARARACVRVRACVCTPSRTYLNPKFSFTLENDRGRIYEGQFSFV